MSTRPGKFYSDEEFREWYGLKNAQWILPNETATDPNNYGGRPVLWAYFGETEDGEPFVAGAILN